jgi:predicted alpha/beta hydrolase family esterase
VSHIVIAHGPGVSPRGHWYAAVARALEAYGHAVVIPQLPRPDEPVAQEWVDVLAQATAGLDAGDTVLVAHSFGGDAVLRLLESHDSKHQGPFAGVMFVATPATAVGDAGQQAFFEPPFDWAQIRLAAAQFWVVAAADDPVLGPDPFAHVKLLVTQLGATALVKPSGGHLPSAGSELRALPEVVTFVIAGLDRRTSAATSGA